MVIPRYTAPEQARDPSASDIFSDMFSLGAIFHALVTGEPPFNTANVGQYMRLLNMQRTVEAEEIEEVSNLSPEKARIIASLLAYDKKERPSPAKLLEMLSPQEETLSFNFEDEEDEEEENEESMFLEIEPGSSSEPEVEHSDFLNEDTQQLEVVAESEEELLKEDNDDSVFSALEFLDEDALEADEEEDNLGKTQQAVAVSDESLGIFQEDTLDLERENKNRKPPKQTHKPKSVEEATLEFLDETEED